MLQMTKLYPVPQQGVTRYLAYFWLTILHFPRVQNYYRNAGIAEAFCQWIVLTLMKQKNCVVFIWNWHKAIMTWRRKCGVMKICLDQTKFQCFQTQRNYTWLMDHTWKVILVMYHNQDCAMCTCICLPLRTCNIIILISSKKF